MMLLLDRDNGHTRLSLLFEPRDLWVGLYWKTGRCVEHRRRYLELYICIVPMLPLRITVEFGVR